jgi:hypothetical protein
VLLISKHTSRTTKETPRNQKRRKDSLPTELKSPSKLNRLQKSIGASMSITNPQSARVIETLSDKVFELSAKLVLQELQTKKKGGRAIILSSAKIRRPMELGQDKVIEKEQQQQDKEASDTVRAVLKICKERNKAHLRSCRR